MWKCAYLVAITLLMAGCARTSSIPLAQDTVQITTSAAPVCGEAGAQSVAFKEAAIETIRRGYDRFVILDGDYENGVRVIGTTPVVAQTTGVGTATVAGNTAFVSGTSTTTYSGGVPIIAGHHRQKFVVKMFKDGDPAGSNAISARQELGPDWAEAVKSPPHTCM